MFKKEMMFAFRLKFALMSLAFWCVLTILSAWLVLGIWYPSPLHLATDVLPVFVLMLGIGFVLGPVLTLFIAKQGKKSLFWDWVVVLVLMTAAFGYGIHNLAQARPVYLAFDISRFELVRLVDIVPESQKKAAPPYQHPAFFAAPQWVAVRQADSDKEFFQRFMMENNQHISATAMPDLYQSLESNMWIVLHEAKTMADLKKINPDKADVIVQKYPEADKWVPLSAKRNMVVLLNSHQKQIIGIAEFW